MDPTPDDLAGVVDLFGGLTRAQLGEALAELAYKRGGEYDPDGFEAIIDAAVRSYHLIAVEDATETADSLLVVGPVAFPELPEGATDLPHILDVPDRDPNRDAAARAAAERFRRDAATAIDDGDTERVRVLVDVSYELEAWGGRDLSTTRELLDETLV
jgi:hypothetical protein